MTEQGIVTVVTVGRLRHVLEEHMAAVPSGEVRVVGATTDEELDAALADVTVAGVVLGAGLPDDARERYRALVGRVRPGLRVVQHPGGKDAFAAAVLAVADGRPFG